MKGHCCRVLEINYGKTVTEISNNFSLNFSQYSIILWNLENRILEKLELTEHCSGNKSLIGAC